MAKTRCPFSGQPILMKMSDRTLCHLLDGWIIESSADQSLDVEDSVSRVHSSIILRRLSDQTLLVGERNERTSLCQLCIRGRIAMFEDSRLMNMLDSIFTQLC